MIKKEITFETFDGEIVTEEHYFNLTRMEVAELEFSGKDGSLFSEIQGISGVDDKDEFLAMAEKDPQSLTEQIEGIINAEDALTVLKILKNIVLTAYGKKGDDRRFVKSEALTAEFAQSLAFDELCMNLLEDVDQATAFVNGIIPKSKN